MELYKMVLLISILWISSTPHNRVACQIKNQEFDVMHNRTNDLIVSLKKQLKELKDYANDNDDGYNIRDLKYATSCLTSLFNTSSTHTIKVPDLEPFPVSCDNCIAGFGWLVIQRRTNGSLNFYRNWQQYKDGFGDLNGEFFIGLEKLRAITALEPFELYIVLDDFEGERRYAKFDEFAIGNEEDSYSLNVLGAFSGTAGDSLRSHRKMKFSTYDRDNDREFNRNCAFLHVGAWWYNACVDSNLNGQYVDGGKYEENLFARGTCWRAWRGHNYGYKFIQMMIRPKCRLFPLRDSNSFQEKCDSYA